MGLLIILIFLGIPLLCFYFILRYMKKKGIDKGWQILLFIPLMVWAYFIFSSVFPPKSFYKNEYSMIAHAPFPEDGKIKYNTASFPDLHGDYNTSFLVELSPSDIDKLHTDLELNFLEETGNKKGCNSKELRRIEKHMGEAQYSKIYERQEEGGFCYRAGFLNDGKSVILSSNRW